MLVYLVVFDEESTALGNRLTPALEAYIDANYVEEKQKKEYVLEFPQYFRSEERTSELLAQRMINKCISAAPSCVSIQKAEEQDEADYSDWLEENQSWLRVGST